MTTDITELAQMKGQKVEGSYYLAECTDCGKMYPSNKLNGGEPLFSGDYGECYCPHCGADDAAIGDCGDTAATAWNYQQGRIDALVEALEKAQTEVKRQENIASALFDEVSQLRRNADDKAPELKKIITEMEEENNRQVLEVMRLSSLVAQLESRTVTAAAADVLAERKRQVTTEGWTPEHDDQHVNFEMAIAGGLYAISAVDSHHKLRNSAPSAWPWDRKWWKPDGPRRDLVKAGALILAEIERLDRAAGIKVEAE